ncbi:MAG: peptidyl-prolyl cis-trans isomerase [Ignavibacteriales bacterium]|nr:MAG: peptidyl-prolyl cis-trans isomerase [Ignavibacteriales bacterium]
MSLLFIIQNLKKHLWKRNNLYLVVFTAVLLTGCGEKPENKKFVARVNDSFLTQDDLDEISDTSFKNNFYRSEIIRNWIDEELLYQEALNDGIIEDEDFNRIINNSRKKLAAAMLLKKVTDQYEFTYNDSDLEEFYQTNKDEFKNKVDAFLMNIAEFSSEDKAIEFRALVLENEWQNAVDSKKYEDLLNKKENVLLDENEIYPLAVRSVLQELYSNELSIIINTDSSYVILQVIEKYPEGTIPPFNLIKTKIERRFVSFEKRKFINEYIKKLYAENDIEVKNQDNK